MTIAENIWNPPTGSRNDDTAHSSGDGPMIGDFLGALSLFAIVYASLFLPLLFG